MPISAMGPTMAGGTQPIVHGGYNLLYLPDVNNPPAGWKPRANASNLVKIVTEKYPSN